MSADEPHATAWWRRTWVSCAAVGVACAVLAVLLKLQVWQNPLIDFGGTQDVEQKMWFFTWTSFAIGAHHNPLQTTYLNYPLGVNLMWNTPMFLAGLLLWPISTIWNPVLSFNVLSTIAIPLSAVTAFLAIRRWVPGRVAAALGSLVYAFSPAMLAQQRGHAGPVVSAVTIPLVLLLADELLVRQRMRRWVLSLLIAAVGIAQLFLFEEFFILEVGFAVLLAIVLALLHRDRVRAHRPYIVRVLVPAVAVTAVVAAYPLYAQFLGPNRPDHSLHDPNGFALDLLNPVVPTGVQLIAAQGMNALGSLFSGNLSEADGYIGIPLVLLCIATVIVFRRHRAALVAGIMALAISILALGPNLHINGTQLPIPLPWWLPGHVPTLRSIVPARMMFFTALAVALLFAFALHRLWRWRRNVLLTGVVAAVVVIPLLPSEPLVSTPLAVPRYFTSPAVAEIPQGTPVLTVPWPSITDASAMDWQTAAKMRFRVLGGYFFGPAAPNQTLLETVSDNLAAPASVLPATPGADLTAAYRSSLRANGVGAIILGPVPNESAAVSYLTTLVGSAPRPRDGAYVWLLHGAS